MDAMMTAKADVWVCVPAHPKPVHTHTTLPGSPRGSRTELQLRGRRGAAVRRPPHNLDRFLSGFTRSPSVLKPGGVFIYLTFGQPHFRRRYLDRPGTTLEIRKLGDAFHYFLYIVRT